MSRAIPGKALSGPALHKVFTIAVKNAGLPAPETELVFAPRRKWAFDYAWPEAKVALEVEGGVWNGGRHTRGKGFLDDMEKYNAAVILGWRLLRTTPDHLASTETLDMLRALMLANGIFGFEASA